MLSAQQSMLWVQQGRQVPLAAVAYFSEQSFIWYVFDLRIEQKLAAHTMSTRLRPLPATPSSELTELLSKTMTEWESQSMSLAGKPNEQESALGLKVSSASWHVNFLLLSHRFFYSFSSTFFSFSSQVCVCVFSFFFGNLIFKARWEICQPMLTLHLLLLAKTKVDTDVCRIDKPVSASRCHCCVILHVVLHALIETIFDLIFLIFPTII